MRTLLALTVLALLPWISGCYSSGQFMADMKAFFLGPYQSTPAQIEIAQEAGEKAMKKLPADKPKPRYIAVRTADPTKEQRAVIREQAKKESSYGGAPGVIYCLMVFDTTNQQVVGSQCYAVSRLPYDGEQFTFESYNLTYVSTEG